MKKKQQTISQINKKTIESAQSDDTLVETIDESNKNYFNKNLDKSVIPKQQTSNLIIFFIGKPVLLGAGRNKTRSIKAVTKIFSEKNVAK